MVTYLVMVATEPGADGQHDEEVREQDEDSLKLLPHLGQHFDFGYMYNLPKCGDVLVGGGGAEN